MWAYWIPMTIFETILFVLAIVKCFKLARDHSHAPKALIVLLRDSILYLGGVLALLLCNLVIWAAARVRSAALTSNQWTLTARFTFRKPCCPL